MIGLPVLMSPWTWLVAFALFGSGTYTGYRITSNAHEAQLLTQERAMREAYAAKVTEQRNIAQDIAWRLSNEQEQRTADSAQFREQLRRVRAMGRPLALCSPAQPEAPTALAAVGADVVPTARLRHARFTHEFARLFDRALEVGLPATADTWRADASVESAATVDPETVLAVHAENAESWAECRSRLGGWQALARKQGWVR